MTQPIFLTLESAPALFSNIDTLLVDCDGVLWRGSESIPGVVKSVNHLRKLGKKLLFISNNSSKSRVDYRSKFADFGIDAEEEEIFNSGYATAMYLKNLGFSKKAYVVGEQGLADELTKAGISCRGVREHSRIPQNFQNALDYIHLDEEIGAIVVGFDSALTYLKIAFANHQLMRNPHCLLIATNTDSTLPTSLGLVPGGGANVAMLQYSSGRKPIVIGKPEPIALDLIKQSYHIDPERTLMIGDRLDTDIAFGARGGLKTLLVLTGVATKEDVEMNVRERGVVPDFVMESFGDIVDLLK